MDDVAPRSARVAAAAPVAVFTACWVAAVAATWATAGTPAWADLGALILVPMIAVTWWITRPPLEPAAPTGHVRAQLGFLVIYEAACFVWTASYYHGLIDVSPFPPIDALGRLVAPYVNPGYVVNPLVNAVIPALVILALGASRREIGLTRGRHTLRVLALWATVPLVFLIGVTIAGRVTPAWIAHQLVSNTLQNGPMEEMLWRGLLQTRLQRYGSGWAIAITALVFGLSHIPAQIHAGASLGLAIARCLTNQAILGVAFGVMFHRTRSLAASSIFHVLVNICGSVGAVP